MLLEHFKEYLKCIQDLNSSHYPGEQGNTTLTINSCFQETHKLPDETSKKNNPIQVGPINATNNTRLSGTIELTTGKSVRRLFLPGRR